MKELIEAILYLKGQPLSLEEIVTYAHAESSEVEYALIELMSDYAHRPSALEVVETPTGYSLQLRESYQNLMHQLIVYP